MTKGELLVERYAAGERDFSGADLRNCYIDWPCLIDINLNYAYLENSSLLRTYLINANLSGANLERAKLHSSYLINANSKGANFRCADLTGADLTGADLSGIKLIGANLTDAHLTDIKITEATIFCNTTMPDGSIQNDPIIVIDAQELLRRYATGERDFSGIVLHQADLRGANLQSVYLYGSHLSYVNLSGADLSDSKLTAAFIFCDLKNAKLRCLDGDDMNCPRFTYSDLREADLLSKKVQLNIR